MLHHVGTECRGAVRVGGGPRTAPCGAHSCWINEGDRSHQRALQLNLLRPSVQTLLCFYKSVQNYKSVFVLIKLNTHIHCGIEPLEIKQTTYTDDIEFIGICVIFRFINIHRCTFYSIRKHYKRYTVSLYKHLQINLVLTQCFDFSQIVPVAKSLCWGQLGYCQKHMRHMAKNSDFLYQD